MLFPHINHPIEECALAAVMEEDESLSDVMMKSLINDFAEMEDQYIISLLEKK